MNKQTRSLILLGTVLALLVATWFGSVILIDRDRAEGSTVSSGAAADEQDLYEVDPRSVAQIVIENSGGNLVLVPSESPATDGSSAAITWSLLESRSLPVQADAVNHLAEVALHVTFKQEITVDPVDTAELGAFGLADPAIWLIVARKDGTQLTLAVGNDLTSGTGSYARLDQDSRIVAVSADLKKQLSRSLAELVDPSLYKGKFTHDQIRGFRFERESDGLDISCELTINNPGDPSTGYTFLLTAPIARQGNSDTLSTVVNNVLGLSIIRVISLDPQDLTPFGLDEPGYRFTLTGKTGDELILSLGDSAGDGQYYMTSNALPIVMTVVASALPAIDLPLEDYVDRFVALESIWRVSGVTVQLDDESFAIEIDIGQNQPLTDDDVVFRLDGQDAAILSEGGASLFSAFYQRLIAIQLAGFDWKGEPAPGTIWGRLVFSFKPDESDSTMARERVIEFARRDAYTDYVLINGNYQGFYVNHKDAFDQTRPGYEGLRVAWQQMQYAIDHSVNGVFDTREGYPEHT